MESHPADRRLQLRQLARQAVGGLITIPEAAAALDEPPRRAALRLGRLARGGWITHLKRGLYYIPPLEAGPNVAVDDPWLLASLLFAPCYVGGWSAAEHWGLTEQIFHSTFVATAASIRARIQIVANASFALTRITRARVDSVGFVWRNSRRLHVSDRERTIVDSLMTPAWVGGVRQLAEIMAAYRDSEHASPRRLSDALTRFGNGAAHKRAGFMAEAVWPDAHELIAVARQGITRGIVKLDPAVAVRGRMNTRWGLWVNARLRERES